MVKAFDVATTDKKGEFKRVDSAFRDWISKNGKFAPENNRYHLYISYACPWASRCLAVLYLKGLEDCISISSVHPIFQKTKPNDPTDNHHGWAFGDPNDTKTTVSNPAGNGSYKTPAWTTLDHINGVQFVRDLYELVNDKIARYTVPILWDKKEKKIVNNESSEIMRMLNSEFNDFAKNPSLDLCPSDLLKDIDIANEKMYSSINNGVYRCGFAQSQEAYDKAFVELFDALDYFEDLLSTRRYICGDRFTEADIRLFVTLVRFDEVYVVHFKTNKKMIREYSNLFNYVKDIYQLGDMRKSVVMEHIKMHYFGSHNLINPFGIIPKGSEMDFESPHNRSTLGPNFLLH